MVSLIGTRLFSYRRAPLHGERVVMEAIEVIVQTIQLNSFSHLRPKAWVNALSGLLVLNGLLLATPFAARWLFPKRDFNIKLIVTCFDAFFDIGCILIGVVFSERSSFAQESWVAATAGVIIPILGIATLAQDIFKSENNTLFTIGNAKGITETPTTLALVISRVADWHLCIKGSASVIFAHILIFSHQCSMFLGLAYEGDTDAGLGEAVEGHVQMW